MDVDEAFLSVGEFGWCQKRLTGFLVLLQVGAGIGGVVSPVASPHDATVRFVPFCLPP